jgi:hypothetical protein
LKNLVNEFHKLSKLSPQFENGFTFSKKNEVFVIRFTFLDEKIESDNITSLYASAIEFIKSTPAFYKWLSGLGLKLHSLALTVGKNNDCCGPHIDTPPAAHKLSWPIQNTENTYNRWFIPAVDNPTYSINFNGGKSFKQNELVELARREVTTPCIINASMIHDVWCNDQARYPRLGLQCMLFEEPEL